MGIETLSKFEKQKFLTDLERNRVLEILNYFGYIDLCDLEKSKQEDPNDPEINMLEQWYKSYDDALWNNFEKFSNEDPLVIENTAFEKTFSIIENYLSNQGAQQSTTNQS